MVEVLSVTIKENLVKKTTKEKAAEEAARKAAGKVGSVRIVGEGVPFLKTKDQLDAVRSGAGLVKKVGRKKLIFPIQIGLPETLMR
ncbi:hypothetical protein A3A36_02330 [Candidatus Kaiserbacteria bacterium RIFCSPLOWO2_01_FULL_52_12b]|uniref:Uncharacterized protein n=1 Tax=Candidatus Kaiserbacteria bacterium RIFCSPLOWO2_01_FULL_52_12b TaxID=1798509 RepID=A0A1F6EW95_9BACT|nr:MAG: hypothetical protein A3A36_02330 [Candidatus Kaiserbacteria bacterium RIFCSPLOWO2_01_FULL_52_12b]